MVDLSALPAPAAPQGEGVPETPEARHNGWTRDKMLRFIELLAECGSVTASAKAVGMSRQSAYNLRTRLYGQPFDLAWEAALEFGLNAVAHEAVDRALNGTLVPVYHRGELVGERRVFNERAVLNLMLAAPRIGRHHHARDWATKNWVDLMGRIAEGPIVWTEDEQALADPNHPLHDYYTQELEAQEAEGIDDGGEDEAIAGLHFIDRDMAAYENPSAQTFIDKHSHYGPTGPFAASPDSGPGQRTAVPRIRRL